MGRARSDKHGQQPRASKAIIAASCKKKDLTAVVSKELNIAKSLSKSGNEQIKAWALGGLCKLAEACMRFLINPGKGLGPGKGTADGRSYLAQDADVKKKLGYEEPAIKTLIEMGKSKAPDRTYKVMATIVNLPNSCDKQKINPERLDLVKIRGKGYNVKVKYGALRGEDDRDADEGKAITDALAKLTSADHQR